MIITFRPLADLSVFTIGVERKPNRFRASYRSTLDLLDTELDHLHTSEAWLQVVLDDPAGVRLDGQLRANARVTHPGVVLTVVSRDHGTLVYPCDRFEGRWSNDPPDWQINLRAIALGLRDLRRLDDYGITTRGQQYAGFRELGTGTEVAGEQMTLDEAAKWLGDAAGWQTSPDPADPDGVKLAYREAAKRHHPDAGGNTTMMLYVQSAYEFLTEATKNGQVR